MGDYQWDLGIDIDPVDYVSITINDTWIWKHKWTVLLGYPGWGGHTKQLDFNTDDEVNDLFYILRSGPWAETVFMDTWHFEKT